MTFCVTRISNLDPVVAAEYLSTSPIIYWLGRSGRRKHAFVTDPVFLPGYVPPKHSKVEEPNTRDCDVSCSRRRWQHRHRRRRPRTRECLYDELPPLPMGDDYHPCATGVDTTTYGDDAIPSTLSAFMSCNCCGITHWPRDCPNRDQHALELGSETSTSVVGTDNSSYETKDGTRWYSLYVEHGVDGPVSPRKTRHESGFDQKMGRR